MWILLIRNCLKLESQYTLTQKNPKIYTLGKFCFEECPINTDKIELTKECKCIKAWHNDSNNGEKIYYGDDYCKYDTLFFNVIQNQMEVLLNQL